MPNGIQVKTKKFVTKAYITNFFIDLKFFYRFEYKLKNHSRKITALSPLSYPVQTKTKCQTQRRLNRPPLAR